MNNQQIKQRIRDAFDRAAPEMPGTAPVIRTARQAAAPVGRRKHPALNWAMAAAAAVMVFFCGFAVLHGWGARPDSDGGLAASQVSADPALARPVEEEPSQTNPTAPARTQAPTAVAVAAPKEPAPAVTKAPSETQPSAMPEEPLGEEEALTLALKHAGIQADQAQRVRVEADWEDGRAVYEVEFVADGYEYEYEVDAYTGEILKSEREKVRTPRQSTARPKATAKPTAKPTAKDAAETINRDDALSAALKNAGISPDDAGQVKVEKDREDGRTVYEVEFKADGYEYEYEIDAATGAVLKQEKERDDD